VKKAYKKLALAFHPDKQRHTSEEQLVRTHSLLDELQLTFLDLGSDPFEVPRHP